MNVGTKIKLTRQDAVPAPMPCQERDFPPLKRATNIWIGRRSKRRLHAYLPDLAQPGHRVKPAAADDSDLRLCHPSSREALPAELAIIQDVLCGPAPSVVA